MNKIAFSMIFLLCVETTVILHSSFPEDFITSKDLQEELNYILNDPSYSEEECIEKIEGIIKETERRVEFVHELFDLENKERRTV